MHVTVKIGSIIRVPVLPGWAITAADPSIVAVSVSGNVAYISGVKVGDTWLTLQAASDLKVSLQVGVTPT